MSDTQWALKTHPLAYFINTILAYTNYMTVNVFVFYGKYNQNNFKAEQMDQSERKSNT